MASKGKEKGNRAQRVARDILQVWTKKKFKSTASEGGLGWNKDPHKGDLKCETEGHFFPFSIEVKHYQDIDFSHLINPAIKNTAILQFWDQCKYDGNHQKKIPILLMRYDHLPSDFFFVVITKEFYHQLNIFTRLLIRHTLEFWDKDKNIKLVIIPSPEFFKVNYKETKLIAKKYIKELYAEKNK